MQQYYDLELNILSCIVQRPELMEKIIIQDKHFIKHQRLWQFMKAFYQRYGNFNLVLMYQICKDKFQIIEYIKMLVQVEPAPSLFFDYQKQLLDLFSEKKKEKYIIDKIFIEANNLYCRTISVEEFKKRIEKIENFANEKIKGGN